jgi:endonuclease/exonuclease/phosphatase family metal-dependent hydrolase
MPAKAHIIMPFRAFAVGLSAISFAPLRCTKGYRLNPSCGHTVQTRFTYIHKLYYMKSHLLFLLFFVQLLSSQVKITSWNLQNFGKSKSDSTLVYIANTLKNNDILVIQEVVAGFGGAQAIAELDALLDATGSSWDYTVSDPTTGSSYKSERYAYLWKKSSVKLKGKAWLEQKYALEMDREPFLATFKYNLNEFTLVNFHAITKSKQPETEIKYFKLFPAEYPDLNLVFLGDFNCPQSHSVFNPLRKMGFDCVFKNQKTSLKKSCVNEVCLASEFDNIWYPSKQFKVLKSRAVLFYEDFESMDAAATVSDHIPLEVVLDFVKR